MENDKIVPGTVNILQDRIEKARLLRTAMDKWPRPVGDKELLNALRRLKGFVTSGIRLLNVLRCALETYRKEPPMIDEALLIEEEVRRLINVYLFELRRHFGREVAGHVHG